MIPRLRRRAAQGPLWPGLAPHGYDKRRAGTLSKLFPKWKRDSGVTRPKTAFYSLRKNAVTALREAEVPQADAAAVIGHEVGFTWEVYAPTGLTLRRKREIVELCPKVGDGSFRRRV